MKFVEEKDFSYLHKNRIGNKHFPSMYLKSNYSYNID